MRRYFFRLAEGWLRVENILFAFWSMFWGLNGLDKFFNAPVVHHLRWGSHPRGWFGVNRDEKFIHYFDRLDLPEWLALGSLYGFALIEVLLGCVFFLMWIWGGAPRVLHRLAFKASLLMFMVFMTGDILFGDRAELWEHGTFMVLVIITFQLYMDRSRIRRDVLEELGIKTDPSRPPKAPQPHASKATPSPNLQPTTTRGFNAILDGDVDD